MAFGAKAVSGHPGHLAYPLSKVFEIRPPFAPVAVSIFVKRHKDRNHIMRIITEGRVKKSHETLDRSACADNEHHR